MAEGGEERAVFIGLKNDAQEALPKIAEKNAELVDTTAEKGAAALAAHAATEADVTSDLESRMPADAAPITANATQNAVATSAEASEGAAEAESAQAAVAAEAPVKGTPLQEALTPDDGEAVDPAAPQFGNEALRDFPNYNDDIADALDGTGITRDQYEQLRLTPTNDLTPEQIQQVAAVRNQIPIRDGQMVTKVLHPDVADRYLTNTKIPDKFDPATFGGSIARGSDTADLTTPAQLRDGLALDDHGKGWTPIEKDATDAYQLRFHAPRGLGDASPVSYGAVGDKDADPALQAQADKVATLATGHATTGSVMEDPFTGTGYTSGGVPEWLAPRGEFTGRAEIWKVTSDGNEAMVGYLHENRWFPVDA